MKVTILAGCEICLKQFVFECEPATQPLPVLSKRFVEFPEGHDLVRHHYIKSFKVTQFGSIDFKSVPEPVTMCRVCDAKYWENFEKAVAQLEAFWHPAA
jgi:hypothetical protein